MIIQIRGTGGSGKSTLVRNVMAHYDESTPQYVEGRKQPRSYVLRHCRGAALFVPGHYNTPTGGCDTIKTPDEVYEMVEEHAFKGFNVLYEGIMIGDDVTRCATLHRKFPGRVLVIALNTPLEECLAGIQARRDAKGNDKELNPKNTASRAERLRKSMMPRLKDAGVDARWLNRADAYALVCEKLGLV